MQSSDRPGEHHTSDGSAAPVSHVRDQSVTAPCNTIQCTQTPHHRHCDHTELTLATPFLNPGEWVLLPKQPGNPRTNPTATNLAWPPPPSLHCAHNSMTLSLRHPPAPPQPLPSFPMLPPATPSLPPPPSSSTSHSPPRSSTPTPQKTSKNYQKLPNTFQKIPEWTNNGESIDAKPLIVCAVSVLGSHWPQKNLPLYTIQTWTWTWTCSTHLPKAPDLLLLRIS